MSWTRDGFFFKFSANAPKDYQDELKNVVNYYDGFNDTKTYSPYAIGLVCLLITAVQSGLGHDPEFIQIFNTLLMVLSAIQVGLLALSSVGVNNFSGKANRLIETGVKNRFFEIDPDKLPATGEDNATTIDIDNAPHVNTEAVKYNILGKR